MKPFEIVAHRGVPDEYPENTIPAFQRAIDLGADAVELDIRLTADKIPIVFHYFYLNEMTSIRGTVFDYSFEQLKTVEVSGRSGKVKSKISTLSEILETIGGKIELEIEIKGPEPESAKIIANALSGYNSIWHTIEITSYEPSLLRGFQKERLDIPTDLLFPRSEDWMKSDIITYLAIQRSRLAQARAVHLHPSQLTREVVSEIHKQGIQVHAWDVNDEQALKTAAELEIPRICTDNFQQAKTFRQSMMLTS